MRRWAKNCGAVLVCTLCYSTTAFSYCSEPSTPRYYGSTKPSPPDKPYCVNEYSKTHTCDDWEIDNYNQEIENYNSDIRSYHDAVEEYARKLNSYVEEAVAYAKCSIKQVEE